MIPVSDSVRSRSFPYVNVTVILACILVFFYEVALSGQTIRGNITELDRFIFEWGNVPACTFGSLGLSDLDIRQQITCDDQPRPLLTLFSAMFMHGGWLHLIGNMLFLWIFGDNVEDAMGHLRYAAFYLLAGILAALAHGAVNIDELTPAVGASGAIAGVMGAYIVLFPRATVNVIFGFFLIPIPLPAFVLIGVWFLMQIFSGVSALGVDAVGADGGVAYFAHIGGFVAGAALVHAFTFDRPRAGVRRRG
jgi:membrane associated rhomboid family serine protease